ncbi:MAG: hypothetical protein K6D91_06150 [Prevotella sp.]|nr:hypothetical protein [Prevotella sp.]
MEKINSSNIDKELSLKIAELILTILEGAPMEESLSYLQGVTAALASFIQEIKSKAVLSDDDGLEKLVLSWLSAIDPLTKLSFSKFISTSCIDIDLDNL